MNTPLLEILRSSRNPLPFYSAKDLKSLSSFVLAQEKVAGPVQIVLDLTHPRRIRALNRRFRGVDRSTDVIAFRYDGSPRSNVQRPRSRAINQQNVERWASDVGLVGDIAINVHQAALQAKRLGHPVRREIRLLLIHGILHLLGYTDYEPGPRRRMFRRQNVLLRRWETSPSFSKRGTKKE